MSYTKGTFIFGVPLTPDIATKAWELGFEGDAEEYGFTDLYSASGEGTGYCGARLCGVDECSNVRVSSLKLAPTDDDKREFARLWGAVPERLRDVLGEPDPQVWLVWHSA